MRLRHLPAYLFALTAACGSKAFVPGAEGGECYPNHTCDEGLVCSPDGLCVVPAPADAGPDAQVSGGPDAGADPGDPDAAANPGGPDAGTDPGDPDAAADPDPIDASPPGPDAAPPDPCAGVTCALAPAPICVGPATRRIYSAPGTCGTTGVCSHDFVDQPCADACAGGVCVDLSCGADTCDSPPADACSDAQHLRDQPDVGTCEEGACAYPYKDSICTLGCAGSACAPGSWLVTIHDYTDYDARAISLALDPAGRPHMLYEAGGDLRILDYTPYGWIFDDVDPAIGANSSVMLRIDGAGTAHAFYTEATNGNVRYARRAAGAADFAVEFVASGGMHRAMGFELTADGTPVGLYYDGAAGRIREVRRQPGGTWAPGRSIAAALGSWAYGFMALDAAGAPVITVYGSSVEQAVGWPTDTSWTLETVPLTGVINSFGYHAASGTARLLLQGVGTLSVATRTAAGTWSAAPLPFIGTGATGGVLTVDATGVPHIVYRYDDVYGSLRYTTFGTEGWAHVDLRNAETRGRSIVIDAAGRPRIAATGGSFVNGVIYHRPF